MSHQGALEDERGFTLAELLITIVIMGILFGIASSSWFGAIESRRVDSATNQVVADLRLAHSQATNRLVESKFIVAGPNSSTYQIGPDGNLETRSLLPSDDKGDQGPPQTEILAATTIVFKANGSAQSAQAVGGEVPVRVRSKKDINKCHKIMVNTTTSRVTVDPPVNPDPTPENPCDP